MLYLDPAFNFHEIQDRHFQPDLSIGTSTSSSRAALVAGVWRPEQDLL